MQKTLLCTLVVGVLTACNPASESDYVEQAGQQIVSEDYQAAIISLKNAIQLNPENADTRMKLGHVYADLGSLTLAEKELYRAVELNQADEQAILTLLRIYHLSDDIKNTIEVYNKIPTDISDNGRQLADIYFAIANLKQGERETGLNKLNKVAKLNQQYDDMASALLHTEAGEPELADEFITQQLLKTPDNLFVVYNAAYIYYLTGKLDLTVRLFTQLAESQPHYHPAKLFLANALVENNNFDEADSVIKQVLKVDENQPYAHYLRAAVEFNNKNYEAAKTDAEFALSRNLNSDKLNVIAGLSNFNLKNYEQAYSHLQKVPKVYKKSPRMNQIVTFLRLQLGYTNEAAQQLLTKQNLDEQDTNLLTSVGYELIKSGEIEQAEALIDKAESSEQSANLLAQTGLLKLYLNDKSGIQDFERSIQLDPENDNIKKLLVSTYIEEEEYDKAIELAQQWQSEEPDSVMALNALGTAYGLSGQSEKAIAIFDQALELNPDNAASLFYKTSKLVEQKALSQAETLAKRMINASPTYLPGLKLYRYVMSELGKSEESLKKVKTIQQNNSQNESVKYYYISQLMHAKKFNEVIDELKVEKLSTNKPDMHFNALGDAYLLTGQYPLAEEVYKAWQNQRKSLATPVLKNISLNMLQRKFDKALSLAQNYLVNAPENIHFRMLEIEILIEQKLLEKAKTKLSELIKLGDFPSATKAYSGKIAFYEQNFKQAISGLEHLYQLKPSSENTLLLFACYKKLEQKEKAIQFLYDHLEKVPSDIVSRQVLAEQFINEAPQKAVDQYVILTKYTPKNSSLYNNIAWLLLEDGQSEKALEYSSIAYELSPNSVQIIDTHSLALYRNNQTESARDVLDTGIKQNPQITALKLNLANILIKTGHTADAKKLLEGLSSDNTAEQQTIDNLLSQL